MLNCTATRRGRDKKPGGNRMDVISVGLLNIADASTVLNKPIDDLKISMKNNLDLRKITTTKENSEMLNYFINPIGIEPADDLDGEKSPLSAAMRTETAG